MDGVSVVSNQYGVEPLSTVSTHTRTIRPIRPGEPSDNTILGHHTDASTITYLHNFNIQSAPALFISMYNCDVRGGCACLCEYTLYVYIIMLE